MVDDSHKLLSSLVTKLVRKLSPLEGLQVNDATKIAFREVCGSLESSCCTTDEQRVMLDVQKFLAASGRGHLRTELRQEWEKLLKQNILVNPGPVLTLLYRLRGSGDLTRSRPNGSAMRPSASQPNVRTTDSLTNPSRAVVTTTTQVTSTVAPWDGDLDGGKHLSWGQRERHSAVLLAMREKKSTTVALRSVERRSVQSHIGHFDELALLRDLVFACQGINGNSIHFNPVLGNFEVDEQFNIPANKRQMVLRITQAGWLYMKCKHVLDKLLHDPQAGQMAHAFGGAIERELCEYYRLLSVLEAKLQRDPGAGDEPPLTLHYMYSQVTAALPRLSFVAALADTCKELKGGELLSCLHRFAQHGDASLSCVAEEHLVAASAALYHYVRRWVVDGQHQDKAGEFFVSADHSVKDARIWADRYQLREAQIPSFLPTDQARKILLIGKSINFLHSQCAENYTAPNLLPGSDTCMLDYDAERLRSLLHQDTDSSFRRLIEQAYLSTSSQLLSVMKEKFHLMIHLEAIRNFLLLRQGDFADCLMEMLALDLDKPARQLLILNLSSKLETAIHMTTAQGASEQVLARLDVKPLQPSGMETGWDVFALTYTVAEPISTVISGNNSLTYLRLSNFLWRTKRVEYLLRELWPELHLAYNTCVSARCRGLLQLFSQLAIEMKHVVQEIQCYISTEVIEGAWQKLVKGITSSTDLDQVIVAHNSFLETMLRRMFLSGDQSRHGMDKLRIIFGLIKALHVIVMEFVELLHTQLEQVDDDGKKSFDEEKLSTVLPRYRAKTSLISRDFMREVQEFLRLLHHADDLALKSLQIRLNYNGFFSTQRRKLGSNDVAPPVVD